MVRSLIRLLIGSSKAGLFLWTYIILAPRIQSTYPFVRSFIIHSFICVNAGSWARSFLQPSLLIQHFVIHSALEPFVLPFYLSFINSAIHSALLPRLSLRRAGRCLWSCTGPGARTRSPPSRSACSLRTTSTPWLWSSVCILYNVPPTGDRWS